MAVDDLLDVQDGDLAPEPVQLRLRLARHLAVELVALGQDHVHVHLADDDAQVPLERVLDRLDELRTALDPAEAAETLGRHLKELFLVGDVARRVRVHGDGDAVLVGHVVQLEAHLKRGQVEVVVVLEERHHEDRPAGDDPGLAAAVEDQGLLGRHLQVAPGARAQERHHRHHQDEHHERAHERAEQRVRRPGRLLADALGQKRLGEAHGDDSFRPERQRSMGSTWMLAPLTAVIRTDVPTGIRLRCAL